MAGRFRFTLGRVAITIAKLAILLVYIRTIWRFSDPRNSIHPWELFVCAMIVPWFLIQITCDPPEHPDEEL